MTTNPHPRRAPRKFTLPVSESVIESHALHWERARRSMKHSRDCVRCALHFAAAHARMVKGHFARARLLGATPREVAAVAVELMAEEAQ